MNSVSVSTLFLAVHSQQDVKHTYFLDISSVPSVVSGPFLPCAHLHSTATHPLLYSHDLVPTVLSICLSSFSQKFEVISSSCFSFPVFHLALHLL